MAKTEMRKAVERAMKDKGLVARAAKDAAESVVRSKAYNEAYQAAEAAEKGDDDEATESAVERAAESTPVSLGMNTTAPTGMTAGDVARAADRGR